MAQNPNAQIQPTREKDSTHLVHSSYGVQNWGAHIERQVEDPWAPKILYKVERDGCCLPAYWQYECCGFIPYCKVAKKRSYLYITENAVEQNMASFALFNPLTCRCCSVDDCIFKDYLDNSIYAPFCCCECKKGLATENELNYCCFCINCVCIYNICSKPCWGGTVATVMVPNDHGCYMFATRCCPCCCVCPAMRFVRNSAQVKEQLLDAMRKAEVRKKAMKGVKEYDGNLELEMPKAPEPPTMQRNIVVNVTHNTPAPASNEPGTKMTVVVPAGLKSGDIMKVQYPDGVGTFDAILPADAMEGTHVTVVIPPRSAPVATAPGSSAVMMGKAIE